MPTYEYKCDTCGTTFDVFQSITARPLRRHECPACGTKRSVRRLIGTGGAVLFKGSGFYQTDYRSKHYQQAAKAEKDSGTKISSDSAKTDSSAETPSTSEKKTTPKKTPAACAAS